MVNDGIVQMLRCGLLAFAIRASFGNSPPEVGLLPEMLGCYQGILLPNSSDCIAIAGRFNSTILDHHLKYSEASAFCSTQNLGQLATLGSEEELKRLGLGTPKYPPVYLPEGVTREDVRYQQSVPGVEVGQTVSPICIYQASTSGQQPYCDVSGQLWREHQRLSDALVSRGEAVLAELAAEETLEDRLMHLHVALDNVDAARAFALRHCPNNSAGWKLHDSSCFLVMQEAGARHEAVSRCHELGGHLAAPHAGRQEGFVRILLRRRAATHRAWALPWTKMTELGRLSSHEQTWHRSKCDVLSAARGWSEVRCAGRYLLPGVCQVDVVFDDPDHTDVPEKPEKPEVCPGPPCGCAGDVTVNQTNVYITGKFNDTMAVQDQHRAELVHQGENADNGALTLENLSKFVDSNLKNATTQFGETKPF